MNADEFGFCYCSTDDLAVLIEGRRRSIWYEADRIRNCWQNRRANVRGPESYLSIVRTANRMRRRMKRELAAMQAEMDKRDARLREAAFVDAKRYIAAWR